MTIPHAVASLAFVAWLALFAPLLDDERDWEIRTSPDGQAMWCRWAEPDERVWWLISTESTTRKNGRLAKLIAAAPVQTNEFGVWRLVLKQWPHTFHQFARREGGRWVYTLPQEMGP